MTRCARSTGPDAWGAPASPTTSCLLPPGAPTHPSICRGHVRSSRASHRRTARTRRHTSLISFHLSKLPQPPSKPEWKANYLTRLKPLNVLTVLTFRNGRERAMGPGVRLGVSLYPLLRGLSRWFMGLAAENPQVRSGNRAEGSRLLWELREMSSKVLMPQPRVVVVGVDG